MVQPGFSVETSAPSTSQFPPVSASGPRGTPSAVGGTWSSTAASQSEGKWFNPWGKWFNPSLCSPCGGSLCSPCGGSLLSVLPVWRFSALCTPRVEVLCSMLSPCGGSLFSPCGGSLLSVLPVRSCVYTPREELCVCVLPLRRYVFFLVQFRSLSADLFPSAGDDLLTI